MWFRRDLRLADNPALLAAVAEGGGEVMPLFVQDLALWRPTGPSRRRYLSGSLAGLSARVGGMQVRRGDGRPGGGLGERETMRGRARVTVSPPGTLAARPAGR